MTFELPERERLSPQPGLLEDRRQVRLVVERVEEQGLVKLLDLGVLGRDLHAGHRPQRVRVDARGNHRMRHVDQRCELADQGRLRLVLILVRQVVLPPIPHGVSRPGRGQVDLAASTSATTEASPGEPVPVARRPPHRGGALLGGLTVQAHLSYRRGAVDPTYWGCVPGHRERLGHGVLASRCPETAGAVRHRRTPMLQRRPDARRQGSG
jgi:hypothetical protein